MAMALYRQSSSREVLRSLREALLWLQGPGAERKLAGKSVYFAGAPATRLGADAATA